MKLDHFHFPHFHPISYLQDKQYVLRNFVKRNIYTTEGSSLVIVHALQSISYFRQLEHPSPRDILQKLRFQGLKGI